MADSTIWKTSAPVADRITLEIPEGSTMLSVADQRGGGGTLDFWFIADPSQLNKETRTIQVYGTGHPIPPDALTTCVPLGTVVTAGGSLVWHVFLEGDK